MQKNILGCIYTITDFEEHESHKDQVTEAIDLSISFPISNDKEKISESDSTFAIDFNRTWTSKFLEIFADDILKTFNSIGYDHTQVNAMWFNKYLEEDYSGWQNNGFSAFSNIYMFDGVGSVEFVSPYDKKINVVELSEGQSLSLPGFVFYRITGNNKKTCVFFNVSVESTEDFDLENFLAV